MGKNLTGWLECRFPEGALEGGEVRFEYGEKILSNGELQTNNQYDEYVFNGPTAQAFQSRFNYHAFRWVHIKGLANGLRPEDIIGHWISTDYASASEFTSSDELLNQIYSLPTTLSVMLAVGWVLAMTSCVILAAWFFRPPNDPSKPSATLPWLMARLSSVAIQKRIRRTPVVDEATSPDVSHTQTKCEGLVAVSITRATLLTPLPDHG